MIHVHRLDGCAPAPLAHYLKALGVLRLVAEQADRDVRGWWEGDHFRLATCFSQDRLEAFFLNDYQPTPIFNPWGARSGFYAGGSEKGARKSLDEIQRSNSPRLEPFRSAIKMVRSVIAHTTEGKPSAKEKDKLILALRLNARGSASIWLDTVVALIGSGDSLSMAKPPIFGTGGNEGSGGYPSAYMSAIVEAVVKSKWNHALSCALFGGVTSKCTWDKSLGQFAPGGASTPWDMLLAFEGSCALRSSVGGKTTTNSQKWMASPFFVAPRSAGYATGSRLDEKLLNKGQEYPGRGEQWLPVWGRPLRFGELQQIFLQGRAATKAGRATDSFGMAKAVTTFGVSRGIERFLRYGYQQRNNQATHFAIPLGRIRVPDAKETTASCLDDLDRWLVSLHREAHPADDLSAKRVPARLTTAYRRLMDTLFSVTQDQATSQRWKDVLLHLGDVEEVMRRGSGIVAQPLPPLRPEWVTASYDGTVEFRMALAFALQTYVYRVSGRSVEDQIRRHWLPLEPKRPQSSLDPERKVRFATVGTGAGTKLDLRPEVVMRGRRAVDDAIALITRRVVEASRREGRYLPLKAAPGAAAGIADLTALLAGGVNLNRVLALARALMALNRKDWAEGHPPINLPWSADWPDEAWLAIRLCALPWPIETRSGFVLDIGTDPALIRRLATGDAGSAVATALRRLGAAGVRCTIRTGIASPDTARLWAAALAFPITQGTARRFLQRLDPNKE